MTPVPEPPPGRTSGAGGASLRLPPATLEGRHLRLELYSEELRTAVGHALDCDPQAWDLFSNSGRGVWFEKWWSDIAAQTAAGTWIAYAIRDLASDRIVGTTSFLNIKPARQAVEIGATFLRPEARGGPVNPEAKWLMLTHAFEHGVRRVELVTDARNLRSQAAIAKLGAVREGVLRRDRVTWTGHVRDTVVFGVTDLDWPAVETRLRARLG